MPDHIESLELVLKDYKRLVQQNKELQEDNDRLRRLLPDLNMEIISQNAGKARKLLRCALNTLDLYSYLCGCDNNNYPTNECSWCQMLFNIKDAITYLERIQ